MQGIVSQTDVATLTFRAEKNDRQFQHSKLGPVILDITAINSKQKVLVQHGTILYSALNIYSVVTLTAGSSV